MTRTQIETLVEQNGRHGISVVAAYIDSPSEMVQGALCLGFVAFIAVFILGEVVGRASKPLGALIIMASFPVGLLICVATYWMTVTA